MRLNPKERSILGVNAAYIPIFTYLAWGNANYEFLLYVGVVVVLIGLLVWQQPKVKFSPALLWGLTAWGLLHMAGGNVRIGHGILYDVILLPIVPSLGILRFDQVVHTFGFGVATLMCRHLLRPYLRPDVREGAALTFLILMMGCGVGAMNEIVEFAAVVTIPKTGVGGYENTLLDLCFNLLGGALALLLTHRTPRTAGPPERGSPAGRSP